MRRKAISLIIMLALLFQLMPMAYAEIETVENEGTISFDMPPENDNSAAEDSVTPLTLLVDDVAVIKSGMCGALDWQLDSDGVLYVSGSGAMPDNESGQQTWVKDAGIADSVKRIVIEAGVSAIGDGSFKDCGELVEVILPVGIERIGERAFYNCEKLVSIELYEGLTQIDGEAFANCISLERAYLPASLVEVSKNAFIECEKLKEITVADGNQSYSSDEGVLYNADKTELLLYPTAHATGYRLADGTKSISARAFCSVYSKATITIPQSVERIENEAFYNAALRLNFEGAIPQIASNAFPYSTLTIGYPCCDASWSAEKLLPYGEDNSVKYNKTHIVIIEAAVPPSCTSEGKTEGRYCSRCNEVLQKQTIVPKLEHEFIDGECRLCGKTQTVRVDKLIEDEGAIWIDGRRYLIRDENGVKVMDLPPEGKHLAVVYTFNAADGDVHTQYPTGMTVWSIISADGECTMEREAELDNLLLYSGMSIRFIGKKGIRMISSVPTDSKAELISTGINGYTLKEYGTLVAWDSELGDSELVVGHPAAKSNYAYKKGVADPVFAINGGLTQYTNVLVGFSLEQCEPDLAMRPYMVLKNTEGESFVIYGGTVHRSIGYIAYQNRNAFRAGTAAYEYIWEIIHHVYGDTYDAEYKGR